MPRAELSNNWIWELFAGSLSTADCVDDTEEDFLVSVTGLIENQDWICPEGWTREEEAHALFQHVRDA